jgi:hypothetical protein
MQSASDKGHSRAERASPDKVYSWRWHFDIAKYLPPSATSAHLHTLNLSCVQPIKKKTLSGPRPRVYWYVALQVSSKSQWLLYVPHALTLKNSEPCLQSLLRINTASNTRSSYTQATCFKLQAGRSGDRIPVGTRFSAPVQTGPGAHPASYTMGTGSFPGVKRPGRGVDHPTSSIAEVKERVEL